MLILLTIEVFVVHLDMLTELSRREKEANIKPDPDIDVFMKVSLYYFPKNFNSVTICRTQLGFFLTYGL